MVGWQMQALMDVMSRKAFLDALAVYHPFWLSAALEVSYALALSVPRIQITLPQVGPVAHPAEA